MKLFRKIIVFLSLSIIILVSALLAIAELAENTVTQIALSKINEQFDAKIDIKNVDLSLLRDFPDAVVELNDVSVSNDTDTMALINRVFVSVDMMPLTRSEFIIKEISIKGGKADYQIRKDSSTNFDTFLSTSSEPSTDTSASAPLYLKLDELKLENLALNFQDELNDIKANLIIDEAKTDVLLTDSIMKAGLKAEVRGNQFNFQDTKLNLMQELKLKVHADYLNDDISLHHLSVITDGLELMAHGKTKMGESIETDMEITSPMIDLKVLSKYIPDSLISSFDIRQLAGKANVKANVKGIYNENSLPQVDAHFKLNEGKVAVAEYPTVDNIQVSTFFTNGVLQNNKSTRVRIDSVTFTSGGNKASLSGKIANLDAIEFDVETKLQLQLEELKQFIPDSLVKSVRGQVKLAASTKGQVPENIDDAFIEKMLKVTQAQLSIKDIDLEMDSVITLRKWNGNLKYTDHAFELQAVNGELPDYKLNLKNGKLIGSFSGRYNKMDELALQLNKFDFATNGSRIYGSAKLKNLDAPQYKLNTHVQVKLEEFADFAPKDMVSDLGGVIRADFKTQGKLNMDSLVDNMMNTMFNHSQLVVNMENIQASMEMDTLLELRKLNGQIALHSDSLKIKNLSGDLSGISFGSKHSDVVNIYNAFWLNQADTIKANGYFDLGNIDYSFFAPFMRSDSTQVESTPTEIVASEPSRYKFQASGKITAKSLKYEGAFLENMSALYNVCDTLFLVDQIKLDAFKGHMNSSVRVEMKPNEEMKINFRNSTANLDINKLLRDFDDFKAYGNEDYISSEQLSGLFSTDNLNGQVIFVGDSLLMDKVKFSADLKLAEGRLKDYPIAAQMGKDYGIDGLEDVTLKTLETKMFITKGAVYLPNTNIKTNTFDVSMFGKQNFNMDCQYHLRFFLSEVLNRGKSRRIKKKQSKDKGKDKDGDVKGLRSLYAIYQVENGETVHSFLEGKDSPTRKKMKRTIAIKDATAQLEFHPLIVKYNTGVKDE